jgi:hypothetical protein
MIRGITGGDVEVWRAVFGGRPKIVSFTLLRYVVLPPIEGLEVFAKCVDTTAATTKPT